MEAHLRPTEGLALSLLAPFLYVVPFYCVPSMARASRDGLKTILFRCCGVTVACVACILLVQLYPRMPECAIHNWLGLSATVGSVALPVAMLLGIYFQSVFLDIASGSKGIPYTSAPLHIVLRDLVLAPLSEEVVFRGYICWVRCSVLERHSLLLAHVGTSLCLYS